jgi:hypothetical protein
MYRPTWRSAAKNTQLWNDTGKVEGFLKALRLEFKCVTRGESAGSYPEYELTDTNPIPPYVQQLRDSRQSSSSATADKLTAFANSLGNDSSSSSSSEGSEQDSESPAFPETESPSHFMGEVESDDNNKSSKANSGKTAKSKPAPQPKATPKAKKPVKKRIKRKVETQEEDDSSSDDDIKAAKPVKKKAKKKKAMSTDDEDDDVKQARALSLQTLAEDNQRKQEENEAEDVSKRRSLGLLFGRGSASNSASNNFNAGKTKAEYLRDRIKREKEVRLYTHVLTFRFLLP